MTDGSVTHWIGQVKGEQASVAEQELWNRYFTRLAALASQRLQDLPPHARDDEDVALSAMNSFFARAKDDRFTQLHDRTDLWQLLAKITVRKAANERSRVKTRKRGGPEIEANLSVLAANEPTPEMLAVFNEQLQRLMEGLNDDLRQVARLKLEGYTSREIAAKLGRVERTVERKLDCIRKTWTLDGKAP